MNTSYSSVLRSWLPLAIAIVGVIGFGWLGLQQAYRNAADDPQVEMAKDAAAGINQHQPVSAVIPKTLIDVKTSEAAFMVITDQDGKALATSGQLDGSAPIPPKGSLETAKKKGLNRLTWEPSKGLREATIIVPFDASANSHGYVIVARSIKEAERRETDLAHLAFAAAIVTLAASFLAALFLSSERLRR